MAKALLSLFLLVFLCFQSGELVRIVNAQELQRTWCVAKPSSDAAVLMTNINYVCSEVDCQILQKGSSCYDPDTPINHASVAMNLYYKAQGRNWWNCDFKNSGIIVLTDPSYGNCKYD